MLYYFAYGSNMNHRRVQQRQVDYTQCEAGLLRGFELRFNKRSVKYPGAASANVVTVAQGEVQGVLYHLRNARQIEVMDPFEGFPRGYRRVLTPIETRNRVRQAWVYLANDDYIQDGLQPAGWYLEHLLAGRRFLSSDYFRQLEAIDCLPGSHQEPA